MKAAGQDVEYEHSAENMIDAMIEARFDEVAVVWRMFADTILLAFYTYQGCLNEYVA